MPRRVSTRRVARRRRSVSRRHRGGAPKRARQANAFEPPSNNAANKRSRPTTAEAAEAVNAVNAAATCSICLAEVNPRECAAKTSARREGYVPAAPFDETANDDAAPGERQVVITPCRHCFHRGCMRGWLRTNLESVGCPECRKPLPNAWKVAVYGADLPQPPSERPPLLTHVLAEGDATDAAHVDSMEAAMMQGRRGAALPVLLRNGVSTEQNAQTIASRLLAVAAAMTTFDTVGWWNNCLVGQDVVWTADMLKLLTDEAPRELRTIALQLQSLPQRYDMPDALDAALVAYMGKPRWQAELNDWPPLIAPSDAPLLNRVRTELGVARADAVAQAAAKRVRAYFAPQRASNPVNVNAFVAQFFEGSARSFALTFAVLKAALQDVVPDAAILQAAYSVFRFPHYWAM